MSATHTLSGWVGITLRYRLGNTGKPRELSVVATNLRFFFAARPFTRMMRMTFLWLANSQ